MNALSKIKAAGFLVELEGGNLAITPFSKLTPPQVQFLKTHKADIIEALRQEQAANDTHAPDTPDTPDDDRHYCHECQNLINGRCVASLTRYSPVDDTPRRCGDYSPVT